MSKNRPTFAFSSIMLAGLLAVAVQPLSAQGNGGQQLDPTTIERLRRDQDEILRKAERLQSLMERLQTRYQREGKQEQVEFLKEGLAHLERSSILRDVASIREDLEATAFTEALRKQREVVGDLERLLNILLARKSIETIDEQLEQIAEQARTARDLERRQQELIDDARETMRSELSPAEQELADRFAELRDKEQREADRNAQQAGTRRPFLESALEQVKQLLRKQDRLEAGLADEAAGRTPAARARAFDLGDLNERVRELQGDLRDQKQQQELEKAGRGLQQAAENRDAQALQQARDRLETLLERPPRMAGGPEGKMRDPAWAEVREQNRSAAEPDTDAGREDLAKVGEAAEQLAGKRDQAAQKANAKTSGGLRDAAEQLAERMADSASGPGAPKLADGEAEGKRAVDAVKEAAEHLAGAEQAIEEGDTKKANERVNQALSALDKARAKHKAENPDASRNAGRMAADSRSAARELDNAPNPGDEERQASSDLQDAAKALRDVEKQVDNARDKGERPDAEQAAQESRKSLESARDTLQKALSDAAENNQQELATAAEQQQQLADEAKAASEQLAQAAESGAISPEQQKATAQKLSEAQKRMQAAGKKLQQGQQAGAAAEQQAAADAMQDAMDALQDNRALHEDQQQQLKEQAKAQEQLTEDIIQLAKELEERDNKAAERAVQEAADASRKAQRAMEEGDTDETQKQQEKARQKLEEAIDELEEEEDRYQDLRQEELLFRMKDELTAFLEKQRPITAATKEYQKAASRGRLSRPARTKVKGLGEEEQALAGKIEFLVEALTEEGNLVYRAVLNANLEDLREVARRLAGRSPDVGSFTTLLQDDVERRTENLLEALEREQQRREEERKQQQQQQQKGENKFNPQREQLVSLIAELEMLKQLGQDTRRATDDLRTLVEARGDEIISDAEVAMIQRLAHRHNEITKLFQQIKAGVEETLKQMQGGDEEEDKKGG